MVKTPIGQPEWMWRAESWNGPILVVRGSSLGDILMALGAVHLLKNQRPDLEIDFLTRPEYAELISLCSSVRHLRLPLSKADPSPEGYQILWDLQGGLKGRRLAYGYSWKKRIGIRSYALHRRGLVVAGRRYKGPPHLLQRFLKPVADWVPADGEPPMIAGAILDRLGPEVSALSKKRIGLVPHARYPLKECPLKTYIDFSKRLLQEGYEPVWFWDPERPLEMGRDEMEGHRVIQAPLKEVALEMSGCRVIVAGDTGLAHLAAAVGRPVISIFGSTVPEFGYTPIGRHSIVEVDLPCRPCHVHGAKWCWMGHRLCLEEIDPDVLIQHVRLLA